MRVTVTSRENLAEVLMRTGHAPDLRCGGKGICGRCAVQLLSGDWLSDGKPVHAPCRALSCRTSLAGLSGEVEYDPVQLSGTVALAWNAPALPDRKETVIGIDIGTTTLAGVKIRGGEVIARAGCFNAQSRYGDNVISRICHAAQDLSGLRAAVLESVGRVLDELNPEDVARIAIAGNTVMTCLFHGIDPTSIGVLPFTPPQRVFPVSDWQGIPLLTVPCISGYVGGDLTAGLSALSLGENEMLVDVGTNCEILFHTGKEILCTAAAAGPAFEGAGLSAGCRAADGAIDHYRNAAEYSVLGGEDARGFCGSGYIDFLAAERRSGHLNECGRFVPAADRMEITDEVSVYEYDIEQLLKAKAAVWAGIRTLEDHCACRPRTIYLAGGFTQYLDLENAMAIGMLPERTYKVVGNTSLYGSARLAVSPELLPSLEALIDQPREIPLNTLPGFEDNFIDGLLLP